jgi:two-component system, chemotaxis family, chemotaxis protein CheY
MRSLIVEDEFTSRMQIKYFLEEFGECDIAVNGTEAVEAYKMSIDSNKPYDLICLDIKLPEKDGQKVLEEIRKIEEELIAKEDFKSPKIFMTTAMDDIKSVKEAYFNLCDEYLVKPIEKGRLVEKLIEHSLVSVVKKESK